jgi:hypothetical protein
MQQQIDQPGRLIAPKQVAQQLVLLRPDAGKARDRRKQRIEQGGAKPPIYMMLFCRVTPANDGMADNSPNSEG